jgi:hypothetical protein
MEPQMYESPLTAINTRLTEINDRLDAHDALLNRLRDNFNDLISVMRDDSRHDSGGCT